MAACEFSHKLFNKPCRAGAACAVRNCLFDHPSAQSEDEAKTPTSMSADSFVPDRSLRSLAESRPTKTVPVQCKHAAKCRMAAKCMFVHSAEEMSSFQCLGLTGCPQAAGCPYRHGVDDDLTRCKIAEAHDPLYCREYHSRDELYVRLAMEDIDDPDAALDEAVMHGIVEELDAEDPDTAIIDEVLHE